MARVARLFRPRYHVLRRVWHFLARMKVASVLIFASLFLAALGSYFPQLSPALAADAERLALWQAAIRARYGWLASPLATVGLFRFSHSPLFLASLVLLALSTLACTWQRWRGVWQRAFDQSVVVPERLFDVAPWQAHLTIPASATAIPVLRHALRERGFRLRSHDDGNAIYLRGDRNRLSALGTLLTHVAVLLLLLGAVLSWGGAWRESLELEPGRFVRVGQRSGLALRNDDFTIMRYPDGSAASYRALVTVQTPDGSTGQRVIEVNHPLKIDGMAFLLMGYEQQPQGSKVILLAMRDPGYGPVIAAGFLLLLGMTVTLYLPHCWVLARVGADGAVRLAAWSERRACDLEAEFAGLVRELRTAAAG